MKEHEKKILFLGVKRVGKLALETLLSTNVPICAIVTEHDEYSDKMAVLAKKSKIPLIVGANTKDPNLINFLKRQFNPFRGLSFSFPKILSKDFLDIFRGGCLNFHPACLPNYRGCFPTVWPIINGDNKTAYTVHFMETATDSGPIVLTYDVNIDIKETGWSLYNKMVSEVPHVINKLLPQMFSESIESIKQNEKEAGYFSNKLPNHGLIDWKQPALEVDRFVRAIFHPHFKSAIGTINGLDIEILESEVIESNNINSPDKVGTFELLHNSNKVVFCGRGKLKIKLIRTQIPESF
jgi:methionyl-tRNA formyltransferase